MNKIIDVNLRTVTDVKEFVRSASHIPFDVTVGSGRYVANGKSIMGILALDLSKPVAVSCSSKDAENYSETVEEFFSLCEKWA